MCPVPAVSSSPIPPALARLGSLTPDRVADLRLFLAKVPDPRSRRGRWYSLVSVLLVAACAVVAGAKSIEEIGEWVAHASSADLRALGVRRHLLGWRTVPSAVTIGRILARLDGDALDRAVGGYLAHGHRQLARPASGRASRPAPVYALDGKAIKGSARLGAAHRHLLSLVSQAPVTTIAQVEVGSKTNETRCFCPLLEPVDLAGAVVTFDALHSVQANIAWLVEEKHAHTTSQ